ncbi:MAG: carboxylating nicotinate-nucleotide diphosphorylase [Bacteroidota bacterium]|jgi:nicotinate-nucleotide pyrophosphorylase (carboxylating)
MHDLLNHPLVQQVIELAFAEDIGEGDHTSLATIPEHSKGRSIIVAKEDGILAGVELARYIFHKLDAALDVKILVADGSPVQKSDVVMDITGNPISMLTAERTVLNFMQRLSGIATQTHRYTKVLEGLHTRILDTRKTTPGLRVLEKWAVTVGGGLNHRMGLYDMLLIKDNHVDFAGGIQQAIEAAKTYLQRKQLNLAIEVETRNLDEVKQVMDCGGVQRIMLDNFSVSQLAEAVQFINKRYETEASGGITLATLRDYAETGVDFISSGALTHSVKSLDLSMRVG